MQDRYAGDVGDYGKIGLLKCLQKYGFTIGVNWYRVPELDIEKKSNGLFKQNDRRYLIPESLRQCDPELADELTRIARSRNRSVIAIQKSGVLQNAVFYDKYLTVEGRKQWHESAMKLFKEVDLVFLDPDNGLLVKSVGKKSAKSVKYAFYSEVRDYIEAGKSVLIYNHRCRKAEKDYFDDIENKLQTEAKVYSGGLQEITFSKGTTRDYFAIPACEKQYDMFHKAFADMKNSSWGELGVCRLYPEHADCYRLRYMTYDQYFFVDIVCEKFDENDTLDDYRSKMIRYLMKCSYRYSEKKAKALVDEEADYIKESYHKKVAVADVAINIGYGCG